MWSSHTPFFYIHVEFPQYHSSSYMWSSHNTIQVHTCGVPTSFFTIHLYQSSHLRCWLGCWAGSCRLYSINSSISFHLFHFFFCHSNNFVLHLLTVVLIIHSNKFFQFFDWSSLYQKEIAELPHPTHSEMHREKRDSPTFLWHNDAHSNFIHI
jgi:hypothetical protein